MKIIAGSDLHGRDINLMNPHGADVCIIAGDIAPLIALDVFSKLNQIEWIKIVFCPWMKKFSKTQFVFVAGNHDFWGEVIDANNECWPKNAHYLKNDAVTLPNGLVIWGSPLVNYIGNNRIWAFESSAAEQKKAFATMPKNVDIAITHTPPNIKNSSIDMTESVIDVKTGKPIHLGSSVLTNAIKTKQPSFLMCGHIHTGNHSKQMIGHTQCYNVSLLNEQYQIAFDPLVINI